MLDRGTAAAYLKAVQGTYRTDIPYHIALHAADVTQNVHCILTAFGLGEAYELVPMDHLAALLAALVHDADHDGRNNLFHVNAATDFALRYNARRRRDDICRRCV